MTDMITDSFLNRFLRALLFTLALLVLPSAVSAQTPFSLGSYTDWNVWEVTEDGQKICFIVSEPKKQAGNYTRRGKPAVLVARRPVPTVTDEVSVQPGYNYLQGSNVKVSVGDKVFTLFTRGGPHAWTKNDDEDRALIKAMREGDSMIIEGESSKNTTSTDTYSLLGFTKAYNAMATACSG
ncbi:MAG: invasion associated locus B family protein [Geminicoccaceae bacterium]